MIKNKHNFFIVKFFDWYIKRIIKTNFHEIKYPNDFAFDEKKAILFIPNHFSWWDGFFAYFLNLMIFKKRFHVMMLHEELRKRIIFSYIGAFSVTRKSELVQETLDYTCDLLKDPNNFVLIFPQGRLESNHKENVKFKRGLAFIVNNAEKNFQIIYSTVLIDYFEHKKPTAYVYLKLMEFFGNTKIEQLEEEYNFHYKKSKEAQKKFFN